MKLMQPHSFAGRRQSTWQASLSRRRRFLRAFALSIGVGFLQPALMVQRANAAIGSEASEQRVKAAYLFRFPNYVEWPSTSFIKPESPYVIGVIGEKNVTDELMQIAEGRFINSRPVTVRRIQGNEIPTDIHLLFIGRSERYHFPKLIEQANARPVLIVTEMDAGLVQGSMINFRIVDNRVRFEVSLEAAEKAHLKLSARLLALALSVAKGSQK